MVLWTQILSASVTVGRLARSFLTIKGSAKGRTAPQATTASIIRKTTDFSIRFVSRPMSVIAPIVTVRAIMTKRRRPEESQAKSGLKALRPAMVMKRSRKMSARGSR